MRVSEVNYKVGMYVLWGEKERPRGPDYGVFFSPFSLISLFIKSFPVQSGTDVRHVSIDPSLFFFPFH